jgi:hypothetical protein
MTIKKIVLIFVFLIVVVIFIQWLIGYLGYGQLDITSNNSTNSITVTSTKAATAGNNASSQQAKGSLSIRLRVGSYIVSVGKNSTASSQYVVVKAHSTKHVYINLISIGGVEPVTYDNAADVIADSSQLLYLDPTDSGLNDVNTQNVDNETGSNYGLQTISWANPSFGVGKDAKGNLYVIQNGSVSPLSSPASGQNDSSLAFAVAPNKNIYLGIGPYVYSGNASGNFKRIYGQRQAGTFLAPGLNKVTLVDTGYSGSQANIVTISNSGQLISRQQSTFINAWSAWSPSDKYIVVSGAATGEVLNASLQQVATIPQGDFTNPVWLNDNTLFYSVGDQLWSYNILTQKSQVIAMMPDGNQIQALSISTDGTYIYIVTSYNTPGTMEIERVGLRGQQVPSSIYDLQDFLLTPPTPGAGYAIGLINFSGQPAIQIVLSDGSNAAASLQSAKQKLEQDGFNLNDFQFSVVQGD